MSAALGRLFAIAEAYPELKADANFRDLQDKLAMAEDELQLSRRYYNGAVRNLNTAVKSFPGNVSPTSSSSPRPNSSNSGTKRRVRCPRSNSTRPEPCRYCELRRSLRVGLPDLAAFVLFAAAAVIAVAEERITLFSSEVTVNIRNSSLTVHETIDIVAEGNVIKRGIFRDIPTTYSDGHGTRFRVGLEVLGVTRDGKNEPFSIENISNGKQIRIGSADVFIPPGPHQYVITYRTTRQIAFLADFDDSIGT